MTITIDNAEHLVLACLDRMRDATIGQCEAIDLVPTRDDAKYHRCTNTGVRIREDMGSGQVRHRTVCPSHGYDPAFTPPIRGASR